MTFGCCGVFQLYLVTESGTKVHPPVPCFVNGTYDTALGLLKLQAITKCKCNTVFMAFGQPNASNRWENYVECAWVRFREWLPGKKQGADAIKIVGFCKTPETSKETLVAGLPVWWKADPEFRTLKGCYIDSECALVCAVWWPQPSVNSLTLPNPSPSLLFHS